ncbi:FliM/FliN family flagellar motor switch protein [Parasulfitobacter algicola]|uniref:FliM/FliN family flagellar motor switch protein n=1 Tax=Parasulfitobacter algicola TaxID=2614809 RepID=A0ABX2IQT6_9RHOB|nr:FliM/FliN family flagellar motor switch protein [Sulfitobacter algicola]NSX55257.1 FliM/FliN family flagellar motor switch protein [Sulfitobacter algicola]
MDAQTDSILRRMASAGRAAADAGMMSPARALRFAMSKAADVTHDLPLTVLDIKEQRLALTPLCESLSEDHLLMALSGPDDALGIITWDIQSIAAVTEIQTMGRVTPTVADTRTPTRTDAAMVEPFLNASLDRFSQELADQPTAAWVNGYRCGFVLENLRIAGLVLEDVPFRVFRLTVNFGNGAKEGQIVIALPSQSATQSVPADVMKQSWGETLKARVEQGEAQVNAVLGRVSLPLSAVVGLKTGDEVSIPLSAVAGVRLETMQGQLLSNARLGQLNGARAVRLQDKTPPPMDMDHLPNAIAQSPDISISESPSMPAVDLPPMSIELKDELPQMAEADFPSLDDLPELADFPPLPD